MATKVKFDDKEYDVNDLSDNAKAQLGSLTFVDEKLKELNNMHALLMRARNSYVEGLRRELISDKAGLLLDDD